MDILRFICSFVFLIVFVDALDQATFNKQCRKLSSYQKEFNHQQKDCLICRSISLSPNDFDELNAKELTSEKCVYFKEGNISVNSDFFKLFPNTQKMCFENVSLNMESSLEIKPNENLEALALFICKLQGNQNSNALQSLQNLKKFVMGDCQLEYRKFDGSLLQNNTKLQDISVMDKDPNSDENQNFLTSIDDDAFKNLLNLEKVMLFVSQMDNVPANLLKDKSKLKSVELSSISKKFPENLPDQIEELSLDYKNLEKVSRDDFKIFKQLQQVKLYERDMKVVDKDLIDDPMVHVLEWLTNQRPHILIRFLNNIED